MCAFIPVYVYLLERVFKYPERIVLHPFIRVRKRKWLVSTVELNALFRRSCLSFITGQFYYLSRLFSHLRAKTFIRCFMKFFMTGFAFYAICSSKYLLQYYPLPCGAQNRRLAFANYVKRFAMKFRIFSYKFSSGSI